MPRPAISPSLPDLQTEPRAALPPARPWLPDADALLPYVREIDEARRYSNFGPKLERFEARLQARFASPDAHVITVSSGTEALTLGLRALGARPGWVCAMPSWTFVATAHAVLRAGLTPWFLDVDPEAGVLTPETVEAALMRAPGPVAAVIPVCPHGLLPDLGGWAAFREATAIPVLLDAAAAFDALTDCRVPAIVSLHATKALGIGEGGFLACADPELATTVRELTNFGFRGSRESQRQAANAKLSEYAAAVGLAALDAWPATRLRYMRAAQLMRIALADAPEVSFQPGWGADWVSAACVVRLDRLVATIEAAMETEGVQTRRWWGAGCHRSPAFADLPRTALPVTEALAETTLGLPFWADMTVVEIDRVAGALKAALAGAGR